MDEEDDALEERLGPEIPANARPKAGDYGFDLEETLNSVLSIRTHIPDDAFTADTLGTERGGNAALINSDGLVVTIGYLITEAETIWLFDSQGRAVPGHVVGYDQETGSDSSKRFRNWISRRSNLAVRTRSVPAIPSS